MILILDDFDFFLMLIKLKKKTLSLVHFLSHLLTNEGSIYLDLVYLFFRPGGLLTKKDHWAYFCHFSCSLNHEVTFSKYTFKYFLGLVDYLSKRNYVELTIKLFSCLVINHDKGRPLESSLSYFQTLENWKDRRAITLFWLKNKSMKNQYGFSLSSFQTP